MDKKIGYTVDSHNIEAAMRGGSNRELAKRENQWNNRIVQATEPRRLPKVPKYRRHNGEEVKPVLFTGATRSKSTRYVQTNFLLLFMSLCFLSIHVLFRFITPSSL